MGNAVQLEFNLDNKSSQEMQLYIMQKQIDQFCDSMGKVRKKLFAELTQMKKVCEELQKENENLKCLLKEIKNESNIKKMQWTYGQNDCLFDVREYKSATG
jgi:DNA repair exonuclease SbcCD ATPase subunit